MFTEFGASDSSSCLLPLSDEEVTCYALAKSRPKNRAGRIVFKETRHPVFKGVRRRNGNKWVCEMREPNKKKARIWLGTYPTAEMAARAHDVAALALRGKSACLNFADSAWKLPIPASLDVKVIQRVANEAALMFRLPQPEHQAEDLDSASGTIFHEEEKNGSFNEVYIDEGEVLDLPLLLADMAQGLLLSPPPNYFEDVVDIWDYEEIEAHQFLLWGK